MSTSCDVRPGRSLCALRPAALRLDSRHCDLETKFQAALVFVPPVEWLHEANTSVGCAGSNTVSIIRIIERRSRETWGAVEAPGWRCVPRQETIDFRGALFMKKVVLASLLSATALIPFAVQPAAFAQAAAPGGGQIQMSQDEYAKYQAAVNATTPQAKAQAFEDYLKAYPNSAVKGDVLSQLVYAYNQTGDQAKTLDAADRLLAVDPQNLRALTLEVYYRKMDADKLTDPAAKQAALDKVATYAQTGLNATKPKDMSDADFNAQKNTAQTFFESAIAADDLAKKDNAGAI